MLANTLVPAADVSACAQGLLVTVSSHSVKFSNSLSLRTFLQEDIGSNCSHMFCRSYRLIESACLFFSMWPRSWRSCCSGWWELLRGWRWTGPWTRCWDAFSSITSTSGSVSPANTRRVSDTVLFPRQRKTAVHYPLLLMPLQATSTWWRRSLRESCGTAACRHVSASALHSRCSLTWSPCSPSTSTASMSTEPGGPFTSCQLCLTVGMGDIATGSFRIHILQAAVLLYVLLW